MAEEQAHVEHSETVRLRAQIELLEQTNQSLKVSLEGFSYTVLLLCFDNKCL